MLSHTIIALSKRVHAVSSQKTNWKHDIILHRLNKSDYIVTLMKKIGIDEAGKGDYFGYLVIAAVLVDEKEEAKLKEAGIKDSKMVSDVQVHKLARITKKMPNSVILISPEKYNVLHAKFKSLNNILAWGHARALENLLEKYKADVAISDKFAEEKLLKSYLMEKGKKIKLIQKVNAESEMSVAAASILARSEFLRTLRMLGREIGQVLPKGSAHVKDAAKEIFAKHGEDGLKYVAKIHFKITKQIKDEVKEKKT
ncbi:MAG: ribonuclease HIII [Candidatus Aenigmarchaeota archaeon]|nr:ribonuclease HIII [Candidatus Aenigmarchaeota archaeon]